ncbi:MAG: VWA domain-containing protein [Alphaproteobacteria bacterium]|nr:VWA domain-containing protein [Alphaproteobacteria bacterium]
MSGEKLALAQQAMLRMVDQLGEDDRMGLVTFGNLARSVQRPVRMNDRGKERMRAEIEDLSTRGSTSVEAGLREGLDQVHRNSGEAGVEDRVFVFTDARPNVDATDPDSFVELAREQAEQGVGVSLIGVGQDLGADLAVKMSEVRGGIFHFLADEEDAERVFVDEFDFNVTPVAYDLEVRMSAGPGVAFGEGFAALLDQAAEDVDFGASTLFLSARSGGMGVSLTLEEGADLDQLGTLALSYETIDGALEADEVTLSFAGGEAWGTEVVAADDVGVFKMAALVDELHALRGAADFCDGLLDAAEAERRASEAAAARWPRPPRRWAKTRRCPPRSSSWSCSSKTCRSAARTPASPATSAPIPGHFRHVLVAQLDQV